MATKKDKAGSESGFFRKTLLRMERSPNVKIRVSESVIAEAIAANSGHCMVADAIKEHIPSAKFIAVDIQTIRWSDKEKGFRYTYLTPRPAQVGIIKFDKGLKPDPFVFELRGAQVTRTGLSMKEIEKKRTQRAAATEEQKKSERKERKAILRMRKGGNNHTVPEIAGGKPPPTSALRHPRVPGGVTRRQFGLRAFEL